MEGGPNYILSDIGISSFTQLTTVKIPIHYSAEMRKSFAEHGAALWNSLPRQIRSIVSRNRFTTSCVSLLSLLFPPINSL